MSGTQLAVALQQSIGQSRGANAAEQRANFMTGLYQSSKLGDPAARQRMLNLSHQDLMQENDPFIALAAALQPALDALTEQTRTLRGRELLADALYAEACMKMKKNVSVYPDANGTMRLSYGHVKGYTKANGTPQAPFTSLAGVAAKNAGEFPFKADPRLLAAAQAKTPSAYRDAVLGDVPVDFCSSNDSTGGNSGSPVLNARGELVGVLFDGNFDSISSDYAYNPDLTRSIHVDIRYILFVSDLVSGAKNVLDELRGQ
jgi:hypothetical protein